ncbi:glycosyltransferase [Jiulongibacter sp. NS-SX5]|uniref:glycosyltransferase n=1 Tax=Jiulongibacter sp. NS-SX5 TaxID=3463854 RepID=UPI00405A3533
MSNYLSGMVIPCYNEANRLPTEKFKEFITNHPDVTVLFVNDGSKDNTLEVLHKMEESSPHNIKVLDLKQNSGKSEAVRQGILHLYNNFRKIEAIGFLDADLATSPEEWYQMVKTMETNLSYGAVVGSRIPRLGARIEREDGRSLLSTCVKQVIKFILQTRFQDTQCGAKVFNRFIVPHLFSRSFQTSWLFDIEIFLRLQSKFGKKSLSLGVMEYPLQQWSEIGDSKLKLKDSFLIPLCLIQIYNEYRIKPLLRTKDGYTFSEAITNFLESKATRSYTKTYTFKTQDLSSLRQKNKLNLVRSFTNLFL